MAGSPWAGDRACCRQPLEALVGCGSASGPPPTPTLHDADESHAARAASRVLGNATRYRTLILNAVEHGLSNARSEATNTHLRLLTRRTYGYRSPEALIAMADLTRGGLCPPLPGRS